MRREQEVGVILQKGSVLEFRRKTGKRTLSSSVVGKEERREHGES